MEIIIRQMQASEAQVVLKLGRKTFKGFESLWVSQPIKALVAEQEGKIVGAILYKYLNIQNKKIGYLDYAFVGEAVQAHGIGKQLYQETIDMMWDEGCDALSAIVKDENVASWKLFENHGFKRSGMVELTRSFGVYGAIMHYVRTPMLISQGMNYYVAAKEEMIHEEKSFHQILFFLLMNAFLLLIANPFENNLALLIGAYVSILLFGVVMDYLGSRFSSKREWKFHFNQGGAVICCFVNLFGILPMIGNWYPKTYEKSPKFVSDLGRTALVGWAALILLNAMTSFLVSDSLYVKFIYQISMYLLIYRSIPFYPFESYGGARVYKWNKGIYGLMLVCSLSLVAMALMV